MPAWRIGIVGAEGSKWTKSGEDRCKSAIRKLLEYAVGCDRIKVVSGECPKGGVDIWARDIGDELLCEYEPHFPETNDWEGFKARNLKIVERSDEIHVFTPDVLPGGYKTFCYHCGTWEHVKNGGCWTAKQWLRRFGDQPLPMQAKWHVVENL
jgi:hypothetical protein